MASIERRQHGWLVRWRDADGAQGCSKPYATKQEATEAKREFEARMPRKQRRRKAGPRPVDPLTINQVAHRWREAMLDNEERMKRPGAAAYLDDAVRLVDVYTAGWGLADRPVRPGDVSIDMASALRRKAKRASASVRAILRWGRGNLGTPFDPLVDEALKPPPSKHQRRDRLTDRAAKAALARARRLGQLPLVSCLAVYGWREVTASRLDVGDVDLAGARIALEIKHDGEPWWHPLFGFHVALLRPLIDGRPRSAPLFIPPRRRTSHKDAPRQKNEPSRWVISAQGGASHMAGWLRRNVLAGAGAKQLKKLAISRMRSGEWPWAKPLAPEEVSRYTGQKAAHQVVPRYDQTNMDRARALMAPDAREQDVSTRAKTFRILPDTADVPRGPAL